MRSSSMHIPWYSRANLGSISISITRRRRRRKANCQIALFRLIVIGIYIYIGGTGADAVSAATGKSDECARFLPKWVLKEDVEVLCKEGEINYSGVVECARDLRKSDIDVVTELCRNAPSAAPTGCFSASIRMGEGKFSPTRNQLANLCNGAESIAPHHCYTTTMNTLRHGGIKDHSVTINSAIELCRGAESQAPASCISALPPWFSDDEEASMAVIRMCREAKDSHSATTIAKCYKSAPTSMKTLDRSTLCSGGAEKAQIAMQCSRTAPKNMNLCVVSVLCSRGGEEAIKCAKFTDIKALAHSPRIMAPYTTIDDLVVDLCVGSTSSAAECFNATPIKLSTLERVQLCKNATSRDPATCVNQLLPLPSHKQGTNIGAAECPLKSQAVSQPRRRHLSTELIVNLCHGTVGSNTAECALSAPAFIKDEHLAILCREDDVFLGNMASADCATAASQLGLGSEITFLLCKKATSTVPAECAQQLKQWGGRCKFDTKILLDICSTAASSAPASCFCFPQPNTSRKPIDLRIAECRNAESFTNSLQLEHVASTHPSGAVYVGIPVSAKMSILDQWGQNMAGTDLLDPTTVVASVETQGGSGADGGLLGHRGIRFNASDNGIVYFESLMFTQPGNLTLLFSITNLTAPGGTGRYPPSAAVKISVLESTSTAHSRKCMRMLFSGLHSDSSSPLASPTQAKGWIESSLKTLLLMCCKKCLEDDGIVMGQVDQEGRAWVQYHPGIEHFYFNTVPTASMDPVDVLGVSEEATKREIRKAYRKLALRWHPDRWLRSLRYADRAQDVFATVSSAYTRLMAECSS